MGAVREQCGCGPDRWYATLQLGPVGLPAPIIPVSVALIYFGHLFHTRRHPQMCQKLADTKSKEDKNTPPNPPPHDEENLNLPASTQPKALDRSTTLLRILYRWFTGTPLIGLESEQNWSAIAICLIQLALLVAECTLHFIQGGQWKRREQMTLATGWVALLAQLMFLPDWMESTRSATAIPICGLGFMSIIAERPQTAASKPSVSDICLPDKDQAPENLAADKHSTNEPTNLITEHIFSASLLIALATRDYMGSYQLVIRGWPILPIALPFLLILLHDASLNWYSTNQQQRSYWQRLQAFVHNTWTSIPGFIVDGLIKPISTIAAIAVFFSTTGFCTSCLGFGYIFFGRSPRPPTFMDGGGISGGTTFMIVLCVDLLRSKSKPGDVVHFVSIVVEAAGKTVVGLVALAAVLGGSIALAK